MALPKAILLDLNDTILDSYSDPDVVWIQHCREFAGGLDNVAPDTLFDVLGESRDWFWKDTERAHQGRLDLIKARREIVSAAFVYIGFQSSSIVDEMADRYTTIREEGVRPFPNVVETLERLREAGTALALITNGSAEMQRSKTEGEIGVGKPDERAFLHALDTLGVAPQKLGWSATILN